MSVIKAGTTLTTAYTVEADTNGDLVLQTNGTTTAVTIDTSQNVGIGTSSPTEKLDVSGNISATLPSSVGKIFSRNASTTSVELHVRPNSGKNGWLSFTEDSVADRWIVGVKTGNGGLFFNTGNPSSNTDRMVLDSSGNLGIGATPSAWGSNIFKVLQIGGAGSNLSAPSGADEQVQIVSNSYYDGSNYKYVISAHSSRYIQNNSDHIWDIAPSGTAGNNITYTSAMLLNASGNLGVGETSPDTRAHIYGANTAGRGQLYIQGSGTVSRFVMANSSDAQALNTYGDSSTSLVTWDAGSGYSFRWTVADTERARITSGGDLLVGSTSTPGPLSSISGIAAAKLFTTTNSSTPTQVSGMVIFGGSTGSPNAGRVFFGDNTGWEWDWGFVDNNNTYGRRFYFTDGGAAYSSTGTWGTISDESLKQDISDSSSQWNDIKSIKFRKYRFKKDVFENENAPFMLGVVAQEVEQTSAGLVYTSKTGEKSVKTSVLLMKAAVALQEAMTRIEQLESEVAALKGAG